MEHPVYLGIGLFEHLSRGHFYRNFLNFLQVNFFFSVRVAANTTCNGAEAGAATEAQRAVDPAALFEPRLHRPVPVQRGRLHAPSSAAAAGSCPSATKHAAAPLPTAAEAVHVRGGGPEPRHGAPEAQCARAPRHQLAENVLTVAK